MRDLIELASLLNKTKLKTSGILDIILEPGSKMQQLYDAIISQKIQSDEDAQAWQLEIDDDPAKLPNLKNKLKDRPFTIIQIKQEPQFFELRNVKVLSLVDNQQNSFAITIDT